jgi:hypothetical protein
MRWPSSGFTITLVLFDNDTRFMYIGIFDTDFDKYVEDAVMLFKATRHHDDLRTVGRLSRRLARESGRVRGILPAHQAPSFMEYAQYPDISATEVVKAVTMKRALSEALDQLQ